MNENPIKNALKLLQEAQTILEGAARADPDGAGPVILSCCEDLDQAIESVSELSDALTRIAAQ